MKLPGLRWLVALALVSGSTAVVAADWEYAVRPGESLWQLAHRFCGNERGVSRLASHNGLQAPDDLRAGSILRIPVDCLIRQPVNAKLLEGDATASLERAGVRRPARAGDEIHMGDTLTTGESFAIVEFADQSRLTVRPHSVISFVMLTAHGESGMVDTLLRLRKGRVQHAVEGGGGRGHQHRIATPVGAAAVRGTKFRVEMPDGEVATVATTEGEVGFSRASAASVPVPAGQGLIASATSSRTEPLLRAPLIDASVRAGAGSRLSWGEVASATGYRVTLLSNGTPVDESVVAANHWDVDAPLGVYTLTVRAIAPSGLEGIDANSALEVVHAAPVGTVSTADHAGVPVRLSWVPSVGDTGPFLVRIRSATGDVTEYPAAAAVLDVSLDPGSYDWQVASTTSSASHWLPLVLKPASPSGLMVNRKTRELPLQISVNPGARAITAYHVAVIRNGQVVTEREFGPESQLSIEAVPNCQPCQVRLSASAAGLQSDYTQLEYRDPPGHPWPIYVVLALLAISL